jgi:hypothetical protein
MNGLLCQVRTSLAAKRLFVFQAMDAIRPSHAGRACHFFLCPGGPAVPAQRVSTSRGRAHVNRVDDGCLSTDVFTGWLYRLRRRGRQLPRTTVEERTANRHPDWPARILIRLPRQAFLARHWTCRVVGSAQASRPPGVVLRGACRFQLRLPRQHITGYLPN